MSLQEALDAYQRQLDSEASLTNFVEARDAAILKAFHGGVPVTRIAKVVGISRKTVYEIVKRSPGYKVTE